MIQTLPAPSETFPLSRAPWDFFATLTYSGQVPSTTLRLKMWAGYVRNVERSLRLPEGRSLWCYRAEQGEQGQRWHLHYLWGGMPPRFVNERTCLVLMAIAESRGYGISRVRVFNANLPGVEYVLKGTTSRNVYEVNRFGSTNEQGVTLSPGLRARLMRDGYGKPGIRRDTRGEQRWKDRKPSCRVLP